MKRNDYFTAGGFFTAVVCVLVAIVCGLFVDYMLGGVHVSSENVRLAGMVFFFVAIATPVAVLLYSTWTLAKECFDNE